MDERMRLATGDGQQVFRASWTSSTVWLAAFMALLAAGCVVGAVAAGSRGGWMFAALGVFLGLMAWLLLKPFLSAHPILSVGADGIGGFLLKGQTIPWSDMDDLQHLQVQNLDQLQIVLHEGAVSRAATASLFHRGLKRAIVLGPLRRSERAIAAQAALQAFRQHASHQAQTVLNGRMEALQAHEAFEARLRSLTPVPWAVYLVIAVNVAVWLFNLLDGMSPMKPTPAELFAWGANSTTAVVRDGEYWRLFTATVLHGGVLHLGLNMFALWDAGRRVCRWYGNGQFLLIYLGAGLAGSALSLHFSSQQAVSVGASGAVFGVLGALLVGVYQHRASVPKAMATQLMTSQGVFVALMLAQGFARSGIDNAAHVGGLLAGALMAWLLVEQIDEQAGAARRLGRQAVSVLAVLLVVGGLVTTARPGADHGELFATQSALDGVLPQLQAAEKALQADVDAQRARRLSEDGFIEALEQRHIPAYTEVDAAFKALDSRQFTPMLTDLAEFHATMLEIMTLEVAQYRSTAPSAQTRARLNELAARLDPIRARLRAEGDRE
ncbi:rhomboid family intramembrane serine protease [Hydrogenophaga palleronii]|uniref:rhomboid family intramembrane serine protease n=1 Tax=Hydrogenophaga palleronii TaxID=65655 RepID=UPI000826DAB4|nr:rhomboid family intramembrane serine protease [Hydrogenophaga palleronii]